MQYIVVLTETTCRQMVIEADTAKDALSAGILLYERGCFAPGSEPAAHKELWVDAPAEGFPEVTL